jgi:hypothetical protein
LRRSCRPALAGNRPGAVSVPGIPRTPCLIWMRCGIRRPRAATGSIAASAMAFRQPSRGPADRQHAPVRPVPVAELAGDAIFVHQILIREITESA